jgi:hypothetical protein
MSLQKDLVGLATLKHENEQVLQVPLHAAQPPRPQGESWAIHSPGTSSLFFPLLSYAGSSHPCDVGF